MSHNFGLTITAAKIEWTSEVTDHWWIEGCCIRWRYGTKENGKAKFAMTTGVIPYPDYPHALAGLLKKGRNYQSMRQSWMCCIGCSSRVQEVWRRWSRHELVLLPGGIGRTGVPRLSLELAQSLLEVTRSRFGVGRLAVNHRRWRSGTGIDGHLTGCFMGRTTLNCGRFMRTEPASQLLGDGISTA